MMDGENQEFIILRSYVLGCRETELSLCLTRR